MDIETAPDHMAARVGYRKSRNGCHKCKTRHVKCNETTPLCHNCARLGLECTWPPHRHHQKQAQASSETHSVATSTSALPVGSGTASRGQLCVSSVPVDLDGPCDDIPESRLLEHRLMQNYLFNVVGISPVPSAPAWLTIFTKTIPSLALKYNNLFYNLSRYRPPISCPGNPTT